jgi:hypothetical protein
MNIKQIAKDMNEKTGKTGSELKELVYGVAFMMAMLAGNEDAMKHFNSQYENLGL